MNTVSFPTVKLDRIGNVGAGEETLLQMIIPPNLLKNDGDSIFMHSTTVLAANANNKTTKTYFAGQVVAGRGGTDNNSTMDMRVRVYRRGSNAIWTVGETANLITATQLVEQHDITANCQDPIEIKLTGQGVAANDVVSRVLRYQYIPANADFTF